MTLQEIQIAAFQHRNQDVSQEDLCGGIVMHELPKVPTAIRRINYSVIFVIVGALFYAACVVLEHI